MSGSLAYQLHDDRVVDRYMRAVEAARVARQTLVDAAKALGCNRGPIVAHGAWDMPDTMLGLTPESTSDTPPGWRYNVKARILEPAAGRAGLPARAWMRAYPLAPDPRTVLEPAGLPRRGRLPSERMPGWHHLVAPEVVLHARALWARYPGPPEGRCTWQPCTMEQFYTARAASKQALLAAA